MYGRKLHADAGRWDTSAKISEMRRCWTLVSWGRLYRYLLVAARIVLKTYQLSIKLGQSRLARVVEDLTLSA